MSHNSFNPNGEDQSLSSKSTVKTSGDNVFGGGLPIKPSKEIAIDAAINLAPQYAELIRSLQRDGKGVGLSKDILNMQNKLGSYVLNYESEPRINVACALFLLGEEGYAELCEEINTATPEEQQEFMDEVGGADSEFIDDFLESFELPQSDIEREAARTAFDALSDDEKKIFSRRAGFFWSFLFSSFFNHLALMVHGIKMTSLVPQAMAGDEVSFLKAVQMDRMLLIHHPYFRERKALAQDNADIGFLSKLSYRESSSPLKGKIQYPALYMLFGILDAYQWLNDLKHEEILDICDAAKLDRYQNRIEDVNYLTKRLIEYRRWQKSG